VSAEWVRWIPVGIGLLVLYVPTFVRLARTLWVQDDYMHGPIVLAVVLWVIWQGRDGLRRIEGRSCTWVGGAMLVFGLLFYILGRSQEIILFEVGSLIIVLSGVLLAMSGWGMLKHYRFALFFILFMLPLPGMMVDAFTGPL